MAEVSRIYVREMSGTNIFKFRVYIKDVSGYLEPGDQYVLPENAIKAAIVAGKALGFPVFDGTDGGKEIWTPPKRNPKLVYPLRRGHRSLANRPY